MELNSVNDIYNSLGAASSSGYQFIVAPIVHPRFRREFLHGKALHRPGAFTRSDLVLSTQDWNSLVVGKISPWINVDSPVLSVRRNSEKALDQEINYAAHLSLPAIMISPSGGSCVNFARIIHNRILGTSSHQSLSNVWVHIPMRAPEDTAKIYVNSPADERNPSEPVEGQEQSTTDTWEWWNTFRSICNTEKKLGLALEISADLPSDEEIERWMGEPLRCVIIPTSVFLTNKKGYPVLPRAHQTLVKKMYKLDLQVVISGASRHNNMKHYQQYMDHLWMNQEPDDPLTKYAKGYEDFLQAPLQPLMDNLESGTYEIFEKDPTKYTEYQKAMYSALVDFIPEEEKESKTAVLMVVGAGRGPLVRAALAAAQTAQRKVRVYAVEKNPNAVVTLQAQQDEMWGDQVTVVSCDMRGWNPPEKADILVSELLGSFGDNELSPECLDGAQTFLKEGGISIPASYTSYLAPIHSPKLFSELALMREKDKHPLTYFETPFVVRLHNRTQLSSPQALFTFHHPNKDEILDNSRYKRLIFKIPYSCTIHGFAGYFDTVLYKDIKLSIHPESHSIGMFSWFPIFFPLKEPLYLQGNSDLEINFWRCVSKRSVWYEWLVTKPTVGTVHNPNGRSYTIGL